MATECSTVNNLKRRITVREGDLSSCSTIFIGKMCVFVRPVKSATFPRKNGETPKWVVGFLLGNTHSLEKGNNRCFRRQNEQQRQTMLAPPNPPHLNRPRTWIVFPPANSSSPTAVSLAKILVPQTTDESKSTCTFFQLLVRESGLLHGLSLPASAWVVPD